MKPITLPIFYDTSEIDREELGLPPLSYEHCITRNVTFIKIDCMETTKEGHTIIYSSGHPWTTPYSVNQILELSL